MTQQKILLNFIDNIEKERFRLNLTQAQMDKKGLTLEKLSMLSNVPIETIRNIIYRRARNPRVDTLLALSRTLYERDYTIL